MTDPLPYPDGQALLGETDLHIKSLAFATDAKLTRATTFLMSVGSAQTDVNGEFVVDFHTGKTLTGCIVLNNGVSLQYPQLRRTPGAPSDNLSRQPMQCYPRQFLANGLVWVRAMYPMVRTSNLYTYGSQPIESGSTVKYTAFGWAP